jgi:hypothetical protein
VQGKKCWFQHHQLPLVRRRKKFLDLVLVLEIDFAEEQQAV